MAQQKRYRATSRLARNQKLALRLAVSMVLIIGIYFGCIKARFAVIQDIYIWTAFFAAIAYMIIATKIAIIRQKHSDEKNTFSSELSLLDTWRRLLLLLIIPMIFALLIDYMLLYLGWAQYLGI